MAKAQHARDMQHQGHPQGSLFNLPGVTYWTEQLDNVDQTVVTLSSANQVPVPFSTNFTNTDILYREMIDLSFSLTQANNGGSTFASAYRPYNYVGPFTLNFQNQFNMYDCPSGIDLKLFEMIRPRYQMMTYLDQNPSLGLVGNQTYLTSFTAAPSFATAASNGPFGFDLPVGMYFDRYYDLSPDGQLRNLTPMRTFVTPQLMSGSNRIVTPKILMNPILASNTDNGPYVVNSGGPTASGTATFGFQRLSVYQPRTASDTPILWGWQMSRETKQYTIAGRSTVDIMLPTTGQLCSIYNRLYDPSAASGGAPIAVNNVKNVWVQYGSGLYKYQDTPLRAQRRFLQQHNGLVPPEGVIIHDMVLDDQRYSSNQNVLNTLDTSSCKVHFDFTGTTSSTAYTWLGTEALRYVVQQ